MPTILGAPAVAHASPPSVTNVTLATQESSQNTRQPPSGPGCATSAVISEGSSARRSGTGRPGSRRYRRWERNNFVGNPHVVFPAKVDTSSFPGIPYDVPRFHFTYELIRKLAAQYAAPPPAAGSPRKLAKLERRRERLTTRAACSPGAACWNGNLGRRLRRALRPAVPKKFVLDYETPLKVYLELVKKVEEAVGDGRSPDFSSPEHDRTEKADADLSSPNSEMSFEFWDGSDTSEPVIVSVVDEDWESGDVLGMLESPCVENVSNGAAGLLAEGGSEAGMENIVSGPLSEVVDNFGSIKLLPLGPKTEAVQTLVFEIENPFCRYVFHSMCAYYGLHSYSGDTADGKRQTYVCWPSLGKKKLVIPQHSFYEWVFGSCD